MMGGQMGGMGYPGRGHMYGQMQNPYQSMGQSYYGPMYGGGYVRDHSSLYIINNSLKH